MGIIGAALSDADRRRQRRDTGTVATFAMYVGLPEQVKGTICRASSSCWTKPRALARRRRLPLRWKRPCASGWRPRPVTSKVLPVLPPQAAPVSGVESLLDADVKLIAETTATHGTRLTLQVVAPVTSLCPCSKKISDYGAHNQRSHITIRRGWSGAQC